MSTDESKKHLWDALRQVQIAQKALSALDRKLMLLLHDGKIPLDCNTMRKGQSIVFSYPNNGYQADKDFAAKYLELGKRYSIVDYNVGSSSSEVQLYTPHGYRWFNTVMFSEYNKEDE